MMSDVHMPSNFILTTGVAIVSIIYIILIFIMFMLKGRTKRREGILYFCILIMSFISLALYILAGLAVTQGNSIYLILSKSHIFFSIIWILLFVQYIIFTFIDTNNVIDSN